MPIHRELYKTYDVLWEIFDHTKRKAAQISMPAVFLSLKVRSEPGLRVGLFHFVKCNCGLAAAV
jgi:hypothetical protein